MAEGNFAYAYDGENNRRIIISYYINQQPNFRFQRFNAEEQEVREDFFKNYLGAKGKFLWYGERDIESEPTQQEITLSDEQIATLRKFYHCEKEPQRSFFARE